ncbi:MAG: BTAD domain-containing putative transcriptional regulator [Gaiellaceae bacterium]
MEFRILGELEVEEGGRAVVLGGARQRALLTNLLLHAGEVVSADRLIEDLYGAHPPATAAKSLQAHISRLRKALGGEQRLRTRGGGYALELSDGELDVERFSTLLEEGRRSLAAGNAEVAVAKLEQALTLWRGRPLADVAYAEFAQGEVARLEELHLAAVEEVIDARIALGRHADVVGDLERLVATHPLRERLRASLLLALYRSGRQAEALDAYQGARAILVEELGIEPTRSLRGLHQAILNQDPALDLQRPTIHQETDAASDAAGAGFVGREAELEQLISGLGDAIAGRGRLFLLVGEPGIGKSRLAEELGRHARARGVRVLVGRCWEAGGAPAYWPWVQSLRGLIRETRAETLREQLGTGASDLAQLLPELRELFPDLSEPASLESENARFRLFESVTLFLRRAAKSNPLVVVLDDLHAADEPSLLLLQFLVRDLGDSRLLIVGAYRDVDPSPTDPLTAVITELVREPVSKSIALGRLGERDVARFIELVAGEAPSDEMVDAIREEAEGNPLFVGEIVRLLATEGGLDRGRPRLRVPQSVRDVIARRLRHLSDDCNHVLVLASVLGREFGLQALARGAGISYDELLDRLDEAMAARVVSDVPGAPDRSRFAHLLIRDSLYEGLTAARRVRLHRSAVKALEELYGDDPGQHLAELAHHSVAGSDFAKGRLYAQRAGDRALALFGYEEAARLYQTALEALDLTDEPNEPVRAELLLSLGEAEVRAGNTPAAKQAFLTAAGIARQYGLPRALGRAAVGYGGRLVWARAGDDKLLVPLLEEGLAALGEEDVELRARLLARLAGALRDEHSRDRRDALSREGLELARRTRNSTALSYALDGRAAAIFAPDAQKEVLAIGSELRELADQIGDTERAIQGHIYRFQAEFEIGDISAAEADLIAASSLAETLQQPTHRWLVVSAQAMLALTSGRFDEAAKLITNALALGERAQPRSAIPVYRLQRYGLSEFLGGADELEPEIRDLVSEYPTRPVFRCTLVHLQTRLGRFGDPKHTFKELAADDFAFLPFDQEWLYGMSLLSETCGFLGHSASAEVLYRLLGPYAELNCFDLPEAMRGSASRYLGILAATVERWPEAVQHFENALGMNEKMGAKPWLAATQNDYAQMLLTRDRTGDRKRAGQLRANATATYNDLGLRAGRRPARA